ncbi:MAG: hypothetical protein R8K22_04080 [Mariprofundaceae bacterium]
MFADTAFASGSEEIGWYDRKSRLPFDPEKISRNDSKYLFAEFINSHRTIPWYVDENAVRQKDGEAYRHAIAQSLTANHRKVINKNTSDFVSKVCAIKIHSKLYQRIDQQLRVPYYEMREMWDREKVPYSVEDSKYIEYLYQSGYTRHLIMHCKEIDKEPLPQDEIKQNMLKMIDRPGVNFEASIVIANLAFVNGETEESLQWLKRIDRTLLDEKELELLESIKEMFQIPIPAHALKSVSFPNSYYGNYSWGRCASINSKSARRFVFEAISSKLLTDDALIDVIQKRKNLIMACGKEAELESFITAQKKSIQHDFDQYLLASAYFYTDNFTEAEKSFQRLADHSGSPFTETSQYMVARTMMIESQKASPEYAEGSGVDTALAEKAAQKFQQYLDLFPDGAFSASAKGLMRRCYWLAGQQKRYLALLDQFTSSTLQAILHSEEWSDEEVAQLERLLNEYQRYSGDDLAKGSLYSIRPLLASFEKNNRKDIKHQSIARLSRFIHLYDSYHAKEYQVIIDALQGKTSLNYLESTLLARTFERLGQFEGAIDMWFAYSKSIENKDRFYGYSRDADIEVSRIIVGWQGIQGLFKSKRPIRKASMEIYLASLCDDALQLKMLENPGITTEKKQAIFYDLAIRYLFYEKFEKLNKLFKKQDKNLFQNFVEVQTAVSMVVHKKQLGKAYLNVAYFMQMFIPELISDFSNVPNAETDKICYQPIVNRKSVDPYYYYNKSLSYFSKGKHHDEANVLHNIAVCRKHSCFWGAEVKSFNKVLTPKAAFRMLHKKYSGSEWAEGTPYYY